MKLSFVELVNHVEPNQSGLLKSEVLPLVWHLLGEIQSNTTSSAGQLQQPTAELIVCVSTQLDADIRELAKEQMPDQTCQLIDQLMSDFQ